jgi:hypothetical protein
MRDSSITYVSSLMLPCEPFYMARFSEEVLYDAGFRPDSGDHFQAEHLVSALVV